jgi:hypothetical protein
MTDMAGFLQAKLKVEESKIEVAKSEKAKPKEEPRSKLESLKVEESTLALNWAAL